MDDCGNSQTHSPKRLRRERRKTVSVAVEAESLWDVDEADCFVKLAMSHPEMRKRLTRRLFGSWSGKTVTSGEAKRTRTASGNGKPTQRNLFPSDCAKTGISLIWWPGAESNCRHADFQSAALPTELPGQGVVFYS